MSGKRRSSEEWRQLLEEFEAGTESGKDFCRRHGLSSSNFYKRRSSLNSASRPAFVAARRAAASACSVTVQMGDVVIRCDTHTSVSWVADLVSALRG